MIPSAIGDNALFLDESRLPPKGQVAGSNPAGVASITEITRENAYTPKVCKKVCNRLILHGRSPIL